MRVEMLEEVEQHFEVARSASSAVMISAGLWLMPPLPQRTNSMAIGTHAVELHGVVASTAGQLAQRHAVRFDRAEQAAP